MPILKYIKNIKNFSALIIPEDSSQQTTSIKLSFYNLVLIGVMYTFISVVAGFFILTLTGLDFYLLPSNTTLKESDRIKVKELNTRVVFLVQELEKLKATNERLKYALILGDSTLFDSLKIISDSVKKVGKLPIEGNILRVVQSLFFEKNPQDEALIFIKPVNGFLSRKFDPDKGHMGYDFVVKEGTPIYAATGGYIIFSNYTVEDGYMIIINHRDGYSTIYKHCSVLLKEEREKVEQGELIALSGNTGNHTTGPHVHFEIWKDGKPVDPEKYFINY
ncbi:MAG: M23 family metallopeptidase [Ignavibacteriaceae bacterium]